MTILRLTPGERAAGKLSKAALSDAQRAMDVDGFFVIEGVADPAHLEAIYGRFLSDLQRWPGFHDGKPFVGGNLMPARIPELLFPDILQNPFVADALEHIMPPLPVCGMYSSNVTMPHLGDQKIHVDMGALKPGETLDYPCNCVVVNFPVIDFTLENGATEIWPGTHRIPRNVGTFWLDDEQRDARERIVPPVRAVIPRGSVLIRDIRLWHRGVINQTDVVRPMIAMICNGGFTPGHDGTDNIPDVGVMPEASRALFENSPRIRYRVKFTSDPIDVLSSEKQK